MENQQPHNTIAGALHLPDQRHRGFAQRDLENARSIAETFVRNVHTVEETQQVADHVFVSGLVSCARGNVDAGGRQLARGMIGLALAAWQLERLSVAAMGNRDLQEAAGRRAAAERQLASIPTRLQLVVSALRGSLEGQQALADVRSTLTAFLVGSDVVNRILSEGAAQAWQREYAATSGSQRTGLAGARTTDLGVPDLDARSRLNPLGRQRARTGCPSLSAREREVLSQIVAGQTTAEIAYRLGVKTTTVATLVGRIFNKLGVNNRPSAVAAALRFGLCSSDDEAVRTT